MYSFNQVYYIDGLEYIYSGESAGFPTFRPQAGGVGITMLPEEAQVRVKLAPEAAKQPKVKA